MSIRKHVFWVMCFLSIFQMTTSAAPAETDNQECLAKATPVEQLLCFARKTDELQAATTQTDAGNMINHEVQQDQLLRNKQYMQ